MIASTTLATVLGAAAAAAAPLTLFAQDGHAPPACLDGSPYGVYFQPSTTNSTKWTVFAQGGGWCYDEHLCDDRAKTRLGTSTLWPRDQGCVCQNANDQGTGIDNDCNCLFLPYGDGASFSGFRPEPYPVPGRPGRYLHMRGSKNFEAALDFAFENGMTDATEFVLSGSSAGGLTTFVHADRTAERVRKLAPKCDLIQAAPIVGYFLDHDNFAHTSGHPNTDSWNHANYTTWMKYIYHMQNLTSSYDGALSPECLVHFRGEPWKCFMAPHLATYVDTPLFVYNSRFDEWQIHNELQLRSWSTPDEKDAIVEYGASFNDDAYNGVFADAKNGGFITSCICHGCKWGSDALRIPGDGKSPYEAFARWSRGLDVGTASVHFDRRGPNGDGTITDPTCAQF